MLLYGISILFILAAVIVCVLSIWGFFLIITSRGFSTAPTVTCPPKMCAAVWNDLTPTLKQSNHSKTIIDLGGGYGTLLCPLARRFPQHHFIGYEWGFVTYWIARFRAMRLKNITLYRRDLFTADIAKADVIFLFLIPFLMERVAHKCMNEAPNARVYACRFPLPNIQPALKIHLPDNGTVYVYDSGVCGGTVNV